jgi:peptide/nickel transport system substrate-binding protein
MSDWQRDRSAGPTRRDFLATTTALAGAAAIGLPAGAKAAPKRGGTLRFGARSDANGLDPHRNIQYYVSTPLAATTQGLLDINADLEPTPGIASQWEASEDLTTYTFRLRKDVQFHNGRTIDAEAVKWNFERILDPKIGHAFTRSSLTDIKEMAVVDKETLRVHLKAPNAAFANDVTYYPCNLIAPDSAPQADTHPIGCGPFKFKSWTHWNKTELVRFENYFETDKDGNRLPYLDAILGLPKKEDRVRLTAMRAGEIDLIDSVSYADAAEFRKQYKGTMETWEVQQVGCGWVGFNLKNGPFSYQNPNGHLLRQAAAHAVDRNAIHEAVFYGLGKILKGFYGPASPWHMADAKSWPEYDPEKSKFLLRKANAHNTPVTLLSRPEFNYMNQTGELVHAMWSEVGFKVNYEIHPEAVIREKYRKGEFDAESTASSYRGDPDGWYGRNILSSSPEGQLRIGYKNETVDKLIMTALGTADRKKRMELYVEIEGHVNTDLPLLYTHTIPLLQARTAKLNYAPSPFGTMSFAGGALRSASFA